MLSLKEIKLFESGRTQIKIFAGDQWVGFCKSYDKTNLTLNTKNFVFFSHKVNKFFLNGISYHSQNEPLTLKVFKENLLIKEYQDCWLVSKENLIGNLIADYYLVIEELNLDFS